MAENSFRHYCPAGCTALVSIAFLFIDPFSHLSSITKISERFWNRHGVYPCTSFFIYLIGIHNMKTKPIYLEDPYLKEMQASILQVIPEKEGVYRIILDQTIFYPMGGGQPTDQGVFIFADGSKGEVYQVLLKEGEINHYVKKPSPPHQGEKIKGVINWERRYKNMQVHSAGHIIDFSMFLLGYSPSILHPLKGDHGKKPYVLYSGSIGKDIKQELQKKIDELIANNLKFSWGFEPLEMIEKEAIYLQPGLPKNKPLRALKLEGVGTVADGGTIVESTGEVANILIVSIEDNGKETSIHYEIT